MTKSQSIAKGEVTFKSLLFIPNTQASELWPMRTSLLETEALKASQRIVNMYADTAINLLLPQLDGGRFDDNWKIRYRRPSLQNQWSSVQWQDDHCQCQG